MEASFWIRAWEEGRTNFHQSEFNAKLTKFFPTFSYEKNQKVLVPLCGKSKDMLWLKNEGLQVDGVELYESAVESFFAENKLVAKVEELAPFKVFSSAGITLLVGDFFKLAKPLHYDFIYDRASLVALPLSMRSSYAQVIKNSLKAGGKYLLIVFEYDQAQVDGPPFSISDEEVRRLYQDDFVITLMESEELPAAEGKFAALGTLRQNVYVLEKQ